MGTRWGVSDPWLVGKSRLPSLSTRQGEWKDSGKNMEFEFNKSVYEILTSLHSSEYVSGLQYVLKELNELSHYVFLLQS